ncbi:MAG: helix-turn-helix transcriptional regulator [Bacteroidaceae bacterium]|nr:helix-turn-helix transcriptional regulator [Bacteroidaceae bacterium]MBR6481784.1 helix-turn-helix transcriptional regulator [Bacteroidaceae bacterium]
MEDINCIKVVIVEKRCTNKCLNEQLVGNSSTISKWCTNSSYPDLNSLLKILDLLGVNIKELIVREYKKYPLSQGV